MTFLSQELQKYYAVSDSFYKGKQVKKYLSHQEFLEMFSANNFVFIRSRWQQLQAIE